MKTVVVISMAEKYRYSSHSLGSMLLGFTQELFEPDPGDEDTSTEEMEALALAMPHLAKIAEVAAHESAGALSMCDTQAEYEFTLGLILDGLEADRRDSDSVH
jgi:hypothetical protein